MNAYLTEEDLINAGMLGNLGHCGCKSRHLGDLGCTLCIPGLDGLGLDPAELAKMPALQEVQKVGAVISPWLWVTSVIGFGLALMNTGRINKMWQRHKGTLWKGLKKPR